MDDNQTNPMQSPVPEPGVTVPQPVAPTPSGGKSKKKLWIILAALAALLVASGLVWYFVIRDKDTNTSQGNQNDNSQIDQEQAEQLQGLPDLVAYAHRDSDDSPYKLYTRPAIGGDRAEVMTLPEGSYISHSATHGRQVAFVLEAGTNTESTMFIYYSSDSGKTYNRIFTGKAGDTTDAFGDQITSIIFSSNGKSLVFGLLNYSGDAYQNKVTEVSLEGSNEPKTLFTSDKAGVFLQGYDRAKQRAVYFTGCYNCDGNVSNPLLVRDGDGAETTLYNSEVGFLNIAVASDFNSVLVSEGTTNPAADGLGDTSKAPYAIFTIDVSSKEKKTVAEITEGNVRKVGYSASGEAYAVTEKQVIELTNEQSVLFETTGSISYNGTPFVGEDSVVVQIGDPVSADFSLNYFKLGEAEPVQILSGDGNTVILGVAQK